MENTKEEQLVSLYKKYRKGVLSLFEHDSKVTELIPDEKERKAYYDKLVEASQQE